jgi:hypothetical protein
VFHENRFREDYTVLTGINECVCACACMYVCETERERERVLPTRHSAYEETYEQFRFKHS